MTQLIQRTRFLTLLKNITGIRGPSDFQLQEQIQPGIDVGAYDPLQDDETAYWVCPTLFVAPVVGSFSQMQVRFASGVTGNPRAAVDGILIRPAGAAANYNFGISPELAGGTTGLTVVRNNFSHLRGAVFGGSNQLGAIVVNTNSSVASTFGVPTGPVLYDVPAGVPGQPVTGPFPFIIQPGWAFTVEGGNTNQQVSCAMWGRFVGDQQ